MSSRVVCCGQVIDRGGSVGAVGESLQGHKAESGTATDKSLSLVGSAGGVNVAQESCTALDHKPYPHPLKWDWKTSWRPPRRSAIDSTRICAIMYGLIYDTLLKAPGGI